MSSLTILLIEDDTVDAMLFWRRIVPKDIKLVQIHLTTLDDAVAWLTQHRADLIVTDLHMAPYQGIEIIDKIRSVSETTPIISRSGSVSLQTRMTLRDAGVRTHLQKGDDDEAVVLRDVIEQLMRDTVYGV
ncbi:MAG: response regulator [Myxococcota bacterium]